MSSVNKVILIGRAGADPEERDASGTPVAKVRLATSEKYKTRDGESKENTEWHTVVFWDKLAEIVTRYVTKGSLIYVEGKIATRKWQDKDGNDRYSTEVRADRLQLLSPKSESTRSEPSQRSQREDEPRRVRDDERPARGDARPRSNGVEDMDDDIPF